MLLRLSVARVSGTAPPPTKTLTVSPNICQKSKRNSNNLLMTTLGKSRRRQQSNTLTITNSWLLGHHLVWTKDSEGKPSVIRTHTQTCKKEELTRTASIWTVIRTGSRDQLLDPVPSPPWNTQVIHQVENHQLLSDSYEYAQETYEVPTASGIW